MVSTTHDKLVAGDWSPKEATIYLKENCIREGYCKQIIRHAKYCANYQRAMDNKNHDPEEWNSIKEDASRNPFKYKMAAFPSVWNRRLPLRLFVDSPMHLLFLGVAKSVFWLVGVWCNRCGRGSTFQKIGKTMLQDLDDLKLQWLSFKVNSFMTWGVGFQKSTNH